MGKINQLIQKLNNGEEDIFWQGKSSINSVNILEKTLNNLPSDYKEFLLKTGGGGVVGEEISGIENDNPLLETGGSMYFDTLICRKEFNLPEYFSVIYFHDNEVCWCIDCRLDSFGKIVSYDVFSGKVYELYDNFTLFFEEYVSLRT